MTFSVGFGGSASANCKSGHFRFWWPGWRQTLQRLGLFFAAGAPPLHPQPPARASSSPPWLQLQHLRQPPERHFQPRRFLPSHHPTHPPPPPRCRSSGSGGFLHYGHGRSLANALSVVVWSSFCSSWPPSLFSSAASCGAVFHKNQHTARRIWGEIFWGAEGQQHAEAEQFELTSYRAHQFCLRIFWLLI